MNPELLYEAYRGLGEESLKIELKRLDAELERAQARVAYVNLGRATIMSLLSEAEQ